MTEDEKEAEWERDIKPLIEQRSKECDSDRRSYSDTKEIMDELFGSDDEDSKKV
jgi:hypothetical protein